ncbi:MAG: CopD family protein [Chloroflexi bacterium]|nr:CopD family protein [Chloroflexota bacterium]
MSLYLISVYLHIIAAMLWMGGMLFLGLVLVPIVQTIQPPGSGAPIIRAVGRKFRPIAWICIGTLLVTGVINLNHWGYTLLDLFSGDILDTEFGRVLAIKLNVVLVIIVLSALHDFVLGPRLARSMEALRSSSSPPAQGSSPVQSPPAGMAMQRRRLSMLARLNVLLALAVLALAVILVRGLP